MSPALPPIGNARRTYIDAPPRGPQQVVAKGPEILTRRQVRDTRLTLMKFLLPGVGTRQARPFLALIGLSGAPGDGCWAGVRNIRGHD